MDFIICFCICICAIIIFALYIRKNIKPYKQSESEKIESVSSPPEIKTEFETVKFQAEIIDLSCRVDMVGIKTPKTVTIYTVEFKTDKKEIIKLKIPQEMYDGLEIGQNGEVTLVEGKLYSFIV